MKSYFLKGKCLQSVMMIPPAAHRLKPSWAVCLTGKVSGNMNTCSGPATLTLNRETLSLNNTV